MQRASARRLRLERVDAQALPEGTSYDALIATVGYEGRGTQVAMQLSALTSHFWVYDYGAAGIHDYDGNLRFFSDLNASTMPEDGYEDSLGSAIHELATAVEGEHLGADQGNPIRIAVDFSCMDRDLLAKTAIVLAREQPYSLIVDFYYSFGAFDADLVGSEGTVMVNRPVSGLEGWPSNPDAGLACVLGLGFESRLALAAIETLEPAITIALLPAGEDADFDRTVRERNSELLARDANVAGRTYAVNDLFQTTMDLDASVSALTRKGRVVLVPLGPKTFALSAVLVGIAHPIDVTVWRLSADKARHPENRLPTGAVFALRVHVERAVEQE